MSSSCRSSSASTASYCSPSGRWHVGHTPSGPSAASVSRCSLTSFHRSRSCCRLVSASCRSRTHAVRCSSASRSVSCSRRSTSSRTPATRASASAAGASFARRLSKASIERASSASCAWSARRAASSRCSRSSSANSCLRRAIGSSWGANRLTWFLASTASRSSLSSRLNSCRALSAACSAMRRSPSSDNVRSRRATHSFQRGSSLVCAS